MIPRSSAVYFTDVERSEVGVEAFDSIMFVSDNGLMIGNGDKTFSPSVNVTRAEFVQVLYRHYGEDDYYSYHPFDDVYESDWYDNAVCWAYNEGIVYGTEDTLFSPDDTVILEQAMTFLHRYAKLIGSNDSYDPGISETHSDYNNIDSYYAIEPMEWALTNRVIKTATITSPLYPKSNCKRKDIATYFCRFEKESVGLSSEKYFNFRNTNTDFFADNESSRKYHITPGVLSRLRTVINSKYTSGSATATDYIDYVTAYTNRNWIGACHGLSTVVLHDMLGKIDYNGSINDGDNDVASVAYPKDSTKARSAIHFYQVSFIIQANYMNSYSVNSGDLTSGINIFKQNLQKNGATVFSYYWYNEDNKQSGHSIVVLDIEQISTYEYELEIYDPNKARCSTRSLYLDDDDGWIFGDEVIHKICFWTEAQRNNMDFLDLDGRYNTIKVSGVTSTPEVSNANSNAVVCDGKAIIVIPCSNVTITNAAGETLNYYKDNITGTMRVYKEYWVPNGDGRTAEVILYVDDSTSFEVTFNSASDSNYAFISADYYCASVNGSGFTSVTFDTHSTSVVGKDIDTQIMTSTNVDGYEYMHINATATDELNITRSNGKILLDGIDGGYDLKLSNMQLQDTESVFGTVTTGAIQVDLSQVIQNKQVKIIEDMQIIDTCEVNLAY